MLNTDEGSQFTSFDGTDRLKRAKTKISMDGKARYLDNPRAFTRTNGAQALDMSRLWRSHAAHGGQPPAVVYFNATETDQQVQA